MTPLYKQLKQFGAVKTQVLMSRYTTFKIGGAAAYMLIVDNTDSLVGALSMLDAEGIVWQIIGGGSNMLVSDAGYDGVMIQIKSKKIDVVGDTLVVDAGVPTVFVAQESMKAELRGFEWGVGVPGTIGGAVRGNAGAMGKEMHDDVQSVRAYTDGEVIEYSNTECEFDYRDSRFKSGQEVILDVTLSLSPYTSTEQKLESRKQMLDFLKYRNETQPKGFASTGCIFKNVNLQTADGSQQTAQKNKELLLAHFDETDEVIQKFLKVGKISAGWLVEQVGMKGAKVGGAEVSSVHGNFVINNGTATAADVLMLIEQIKEAVYTKYSITLEEEVHIIY
jgi:UDP-N-acetylmuramate dehydrogenase